MWCSVGTEELGPFCSVINCVLVGLISVTRSM